MTLLNLNTMNLLDLTPAQLTAKVNNERFKFDNSGVQETCEATGELPSEGDDYYNAADPLIGLLKETPVHRLMINLRASGSSIKEIAEATGYTPIHVGNVLRQPWARKRILEMQTGEGLSELRNVIERAGRKALTLLEDSLDEAEIPANVKSNNAQYLANRLLGKPSNSLILDDRRNPRELSTAELADLLQRTKN